MNILIISQSLTGGGAEKVAANLSLVLSQKYNVFLLTYIKNENEYLYGGKRVNISSDGNNVLSRLYQFFRRLILVSKFKKENKIDYSISFVPQCDYANVLSGGNKTKKVIEVSSNMSVAFPKGIKRAFRRYILKQADFVAAVSKGSELDLLNNWGIKSDKLTTIYNTIDIKRIEEQLTKEFEAPHYIKDGNYIVCMGSFRKAKGHWHLIKAFSLVKNKYPNLKLVILGDGIYRESYTKLISKLNLEGRVFMPGFVDNPYSLIKNSILMVFPSLYEGFGNAIIEAMICRVPVIATDCDFGPREIISPSSDVQFKASSIEISKYGVLIPPFDMSDIDVTPITNQNEELLAKAIENLMDNTILREDLSRNAYDYCYRFSNNNYAYQWESFLNI